MKKILYSIFTISLFYNLISGLFMYDQIRCSNGKLYYREMYEKTGDYKGLRTRSYRTVFNHNYKICSIIGVYDLYGRTQARQNEIEEWRKNKE